MEASMGSCHVLYMTKSLFTRIFQPVISSVMTVVWQASLESWKRCQAHAQLPLLCYGVRSTSRRVDVSAETRATVCSRWNIRPQSEIDHDPSRGLRSEVAENSIPENAAAHVGPVGAWAKKPTDMGASGSRRQKILCSVQRLPSK